MSKEERLAFGRADFLIPEEIEMEKWSVIACDQYTSDRKYWESVSSIAGNKPSALNLILPEAYLENDNSARVEDINSSMRQYLNAGILKEYKNCYIYIERTLSTGAIRPGVVGIVDMECYSFIDGALCNIKPTEQTVQERIPPRKAVRDNAKIELSHVILFCNDTTNSLVGYLTSVKESMKKVYDFDLMMNGGHITGWVVEGEIAEEFDRRYEKYAVSNTPQLIVGDGNHSLATAKAVYEGDKSNPKARYAMVELQNIFDASIEFKPIHRVLFDVDKDTFLKYVSKKCEGDCAIHWMTNTDNGDLMISVKEGQLPIETLQPVIDAYLSDFGGSVDYIHDGVEAIVDENDSSIGILLPAINKEDIFDRIANKGVYPRKTFSVGEANDKRFYLESRIIK